MGGEHSYRGIRSRWITAAVAAAVILSGCGGDDDDSAGAQGEVSSGDLSVLSAFYPIHEVVTRIGGDRIDATNLTPAGTEPHDLELTTDDIDDVQAADAVFYLGEGFMPVLDRALERADGEQVNLLEGLPLRKAAGGDDHGHGGEEAHEEEAAAGEPDEHEGEEGEHQEGEPEEGEHEGEEDHGGESLDPHVWLDPTLMIRMATQVEEILSTLDPDGEEEYAQRRSEYQDELEALDREYEDTLMDCQRNVFVTSHEAFGYLAQRYGLEEQAVSGLSPETEPDPDRIAELAEVISELGVPVVFAETLLPVDLAEALAREANVRVDVLNPIEGLTEEEIADEADYLSVMRDNLVALEGALDCAGAEDPADEEP